MRGRRRLRHSAQCLQRFDHRPNLRRRLPHGLVNGLLQFHNPCRHVIHFLQVIGQRGLQRRLLETHVALDPLQMLLGPGFHPFRPAPVSQQKLAQPMPRLQLIFLGRFARPHQIAQGLMGRIRHPHRRQFAGTVAARQLLRIAAVGLHPISGLGRNQAGRDHLTGNPQLRELPIQHVPGRPGLIAGPQLLHRSELANQFANRFQAVRDHSERTDLSARFGHRHGDRLGMDIQTYKAYLRHCDQLLSYAALRRWISPLRSVTRATANRRLVAP